VEQRLPQLSGPALALLTASLPQLLPAGGNLRLWRQLGGVVQSQGSRLTAEQLCEVLPLVQVCDRQWCCDSASSTGAAQKLCRGQQPLLLVFPAEVSHRLIVQRSATGSQVDFFPLVHVL
jgi:hypothetical protein